MNVVRQLTSRVVAGGILGFCSRAIVVKETLPKFISKQAALTSVIAIGAWRARG